jgi:hypothetical protein
MTRNTGLVCCSVIATLIFFAGCSVFHDRPIGNRNQIVILADLTVWQPVADPLKLVFEKEVLTPQPEKTYYLEHVDYNELAEISRRPYILVVAPLKSSEPVSVFLSNSLSPQAADGVFQGDYYVFAKPDLWARDQLVLFVTAPDIESLLERIDQHSGDLYSLIDQHRNEVIQGEMYARLEQKDLERRFQKQYGWHMRMQHDYIPVIENPNRNLVQLKRNYPDRWLTILWRDGEDKYRSLETVSAIRDSLGKWFSDPVFTYPEYHKYRDIEFLGRPGGILAGLWATEADIGGGPFFTYVIFDSLNARTFFIDGAVFAPHDFKEPFLRQLHIMARTFVPGKVE